MTTDIDNKRWSAHVSDNIRAEMARRRLSYGKLANLSNVPVHTIRRRMSGNTHAFTIDELQSISEALQVPISRLLWDK